MAYTGSSSDPIIVKVFSDLAYFKQLLENDAKNSRQEDKKKEDFEQIGHGNLLTQQNLPEVSSSPEVIKTTEATQQQTGQGLADDEVQQLGDGDHARKRTLAHADEEVIRKIIRQELKVFFEKPPPSLMSIVKNTKLGDIAEKAAGIAKYVPFIKQLVGHGDDDDDDDDGAQVGHGFVDDDLAQSPANVFHNIGQHSETADATSAADVALQETAGETFHYDKEKLLADIPRPSHRKALKLLEWLMGQPMTIFWSPVDEVLTIKDKKIPNANIYRVFSELYKSKPDYQVNGYIPLVNFILNAGQGHLINKTKFWFLARRQKLKGKENQVGGSESDLDDWYFIGDVQ